MSFIYCESIIIASDFCFVYGNRFFFCFYYCHCLHSDLLSCSYLLVYTIFLYCVLHMFVFCLSCCVFVCLFFVCVCVCFFNYLFFCYLGRSINVTLRRKSKDWLARNQYNVSLWRDMSIHGLVFFQ